MVHMVMVWLTLGMLGNFVGFFLSSAGFFFFKIIFFKIQSECQTVGIQVKTSG